MAFGWLFAQVPAPRNDRHLPEIVLFSLSVLLLGIPTVYWYRVANKRADLVAFLGAALLGLQVLACTWGLAGLVVYAVQVTTSGM